MSNSVMTMITQFFVFDLESKTAILSKGQIVCLESSRVRDNDFSMGDSSNSDDMPDQGKLLFSPSVTDSLGTVELYI